MKPPADLERAIRQEETEGELDRAKQEYLKRQRTEFRNHLVSYAIVNAFLLVINLMSSPDYLWVMWPMVGWGMGLAFHAADTFLIDDRKLEKHAFVVLVFYRGYW